ncbi:MAG: Gfo/Idh/MocA family protein [Blastocatellia bacterium]
MKELRFAIFGAGFWTRYQYSGWMELEGVKCVAIYNRTRARAEAIAREFGIPAVYDDAEELLKTEKLDFVDNITEIGGHKPLTLLAAQYRMPVICQKPMAASFADAREMVAACREAGVPFFVHENWRWQTAIRQFRNTLATGEIGRPFRARIEMKSGFPVFKNQPFLAELEQFILTDGGSHLLDTARFLFGEAESLYCQIHRAQPQIKGEDVATVMMKMGGQTTVLCELALCEGLSLEREHFPETFIFVEGDKGSAELAPDFWVRVTTSEGTRAKRFPPPRYAWADPAYDAGHASIVPCNANLLAALRGEAEAETTGEDNLKTMRLVFAAYESARQDRVVKFQVEESGE